MKVAKNLSIGLLVICLLALNFCAAALGEENPKLTRWTTWTEEDVEDVYTHVLSDVLDNVELETVCVPGTEYEQKLKIAITGGSAPDIFDVDGVYTANYAYIGALYPLDEFWDIEDFKSDYVQSSQDKCMFDGHIYAASLYETACALFYNKDHFEAAGVEIPEDPNTPWTFEQLIDAAKKCTIVDETGTTVQYGLLPTMNAPDVNNEGTAFLQFFWLWNHGAEVFDADLTTADGYFNSEKSIEALKEWQALFQEYKVSPLETVTQGFQTGKISMMIHNISNCSNLDTSYPDINYGVMVLPAGENNYTTSGGWNIGISSGCENPEAAWKIIEALTGYEGHKAYCELKAFMPSRISVIEDMDLLQEYPLSVGRVQMLGNTRARPVSPAYAELSPIFCEAVNAIAYGEDIEQTVNNAVKKMERVFVKY